MNASNEVNVAEILKKYAEPGQQLYAGHGAVTYDRYNEERKRIIVVEIGNGGIYDWEYDDFGHLADRHGWVDDRVSLFPSRFMRDWEKFALKPGDVLCGERGEGIMAVFGGWTDDTYTRFKSPCFLYNNCTFGEGDTFLAQDYEKVADCVRKRFYKLLELHYKGRFDPITAKLTI